MRVRHMSQYLFYFMANPLWMMLNLINADIARQHNAVQQMMKNHKLDKHGRKNCTNRVCFFCGDELKICTLNLH